MYATRYILRVRAGAKDKARQYVTCGKREPKLYATRLADKDPKNDESRHYVACGRRIRGCTPPSWWPEKGKARHYAGGVRCLIVRRRVWPSAKMGDSSSNGNPANATRGLEPLRGKYPMLFENWKNHHRAEHISPGFSFSQCSGGSDPLFAPRLLSPNDRPLTTDPTVDSLLPLCLWWLRNQLSSGAKSPEGNYRDQ